MAKKVAAKAAAENLQNAIPSPSKQEDPLDGYEVKDHLDTLTRAHEIINNPKKMALVHKLAGRKAKALAGIKSLPDAGAQSDNFKAKSTQDLVDYRNKKYGPGARASKKHALSALKNPPDLDTDGE